MGAEPYRTIEPTKYDVANEVLASAVRILQAVGFDEQEIPKLFHQVASQPSRGPIWVEALE